MCVWCIVYLSDNILDTVDLVAKGLDYVERMLGFPSVSELRFHDSFKLKFTGLLFKSQSLK